MSKVTTVDQYEKLCDMMATKRDIVQGFQKRPKEEIQEFWAHQQKIRIHGERSGLTGNT
ncbi:PREDICTED: uncharacterized protein LOC108976371 isoform X2 [Bactrocera latifrons]|uniref:uncharacterized protein LOC108976371 isoform X2 n=1 Tax=Bactrocera latifrons TaxID=174628 RepID=UPI0008DD09FD|nr:PREDICTED: uncharacterized protein LOC108976371 isoform X2 [Bactrocera latifrons]